MFACREGGGVAKVCVDCGIEIVEVIKVGDSSAEGKRWQLWVVWQRKRE